MKLKVYKSDGSSFSEKEFDLPSFEGDKGVALLKQVIVSYQANKRQGTSKTITVQAKKIALQRALFDLANEGGLAVIERFEVAKPKTALFAKVLKNVSPEGKRLLVVDSTWSEPVLRASRNISRALFSNSSNLNALDLVKTPRVLITLEGLTKVLERT
ncbi:MAG: 50S ribosomal protein L4, partial [Verrucomicrobia bacterium]|nr:50S ribosomal protein L4 [Verrucomicrobiota bacterium]